MESTEWIVPWPVEITPRWKINSMQRQKDCYIKPIWKEYIIKLEVGRKIRDELTHSNFFSGGLSARTSKGRIGVDKASYSNQEEHGKTTGTLRNQTKIIIERIFDL